MLLLLPLLLLAVYEQTLDYPFYFDDTSNIINNPHLQLKEFSVAGLKRVVSGAHLHNRPVANLSFALNYLWGQYDPAVYRLINILIHGINGFLLFLLVGRTLKIFQGNGSREGFGVWESAYFAAVIWLVHPLHIQSVTYIVQRMNSMAAMFYLLAMLCYIQGRLSEKSREKWLWGSGCLASGLLAFGSKEIAATLPFMLWIYEWFFFQRLDRQWLKRNGRNLVIGLVLGLALVYFYLGDNPWERLQAGYGLRDFTMGQRFITQWRVIVFYISLFLFPYPSRLTLLHDFPASTSLLEPITTLLSLITLLALTFSAFWLIRRHRLWAFCLLWFLGNLVIESSIIGLEIIYEHRTYLPSMFLSLLLVLTLRKVLTNDRIKRVVLVSIMIVLSIWTFQRNRVWADKVDFWLDCLVKCHDQARIHNNLGQALEEKGRVADAMEHYREAIAHDELYVTAYNNLGLALEKAGDLHDAEQVYRHVLSFDRLNAGTHYNLGTHLGRRGRVEEALAHLDLSHQNQPLDSDPDVHNNAGIILAMYGRLDEAVGHFQEALRINPDDFLTHNNLALTYARQGDFIRARYHFQETLRIRPDFEEARQNLLFLAEKEHGR